MPKPKIDDSVSLFPFLDIMASLIGILVLLITAATLAQIGQTVEDTADAQAVAKAKARIVRYRAVNERTDAQQMKERLPPLQAEAERLQKLIEEAEPTLEELQKQLAEFRTLLANRKEAGQQEIQIMPSGSGYDLTPTFVECSANSVVLHDRPEPLRIPIGKLSSHEAFSNLLDSVKQQPKGTVVFLVRPDGASTYQVARNIARGRYVTNGKLAVAGQGKLDLSLFQKK